MTTPTSSAGSSAGNSAQIDSSAQMESPELNPDTVSSSYEPSECLFCNYISADITENLQHMSKSHNFFIPDQEYLIHTPSFLGFLNTTISDFHECLYCGTTRSNKWAAQDHMKSKGHCRIDVEDEEWEDFWYFPEPDGNDVEGPEQDGSSAITNFDDEIRLPSGKTLGHRSRAQYFKRNQNRTPLSAPVPREIQNSNITPGSQSQGSSSSNQLVMRTGTSTSLIGVSELQQKAIRAIEKKGMQMETRARNRYRSRVETKANMTLQKHFKPDVPGPKNG